ncbi:hypothetical protein RJT34_02470 [Clitoria ternatea]|uniref:Uncharacterized protein n=1 Tax=Clitoria ternatea TaxID=43366 RepID=A0AAN9KHU4_CLITE
MSAKDTPSTHVVIAFDRDDVSPSRPMEPTLPYVCDVKVIASTNQRYGDPPRPLMVDKLDKLSARQYIPILVEDKDAEEDPDEKPINIIRGLTGVMIPTL